MGNMDIMVQTGTHPVAPGSRAENNNFSMTAKAYNPIQSGSVQSGWRSPSPLLSDGHPPTAFVPLFFWFVHRRWECLQMTIIPYREVREVPSGGSVQLARETAATAGERRSHN
jgi:hypothetical protein